MSRHPSPAVERVVAPAPSEERVTLLVVSGVRLYSEGLAQSLVRLAGFHVATAGDADAAMRRLHASEVAVMLLDMAMRDSLPLVREARQASPGVRVVAFAVAEVAADVVACARAGVDGYLPSDAGLADLLAAIETVSRGGTVCSPCMAGTLFRQLGREPTGAEAPHPPLTSRERDIAELLDRGLSNKAIAGRLGIELATVKHHVHNILDKLAVRRRGEAVAELRRQAPRSLAPRTDEARRAD